MEEVKNRVILYSMFSLNFRTCTDVDEVVEWQWVTCDSPRVVRRGVGCEWGVWLVPVCLEWCVATMLAVAQLIRLLAVLSATYVCDPTANSILYIAYYTIKLRNDATTTRNKHVPCYVRARSLKNRWP